MWTVINAVTQEGVLLEPLPFLGAVYWFMYFKSRYPNIEFDLINVELCDGT